MILPLLNGTMSILDGFKLASMDVPFNDVLKALSQVRRPNCRIFSRLTSQSQVLSDYLSSVEIKVEVFVRDFPDFNYPDTLYNCTGPLLKKCSISNMVIALHPFVWSKKMVCFRLFGNEQTSQVDICIARAI